MSVKKTLYEEFPGRKQQINALYSLIGRNGEDPVSSVFVYGQTATGKSCIVDRLLKLCGAVYSISNCIECYTSKLLFEPMLVSLLGTEYCHEIGEKCDSLMTFINKLKTASGEGKFKNKNCVIVLDGCERLHDIGWHYLPAFSRLQELTGIPNLSVVFISHIIPEKFIPECSSTKVNFTQYSKADLLEILLLERSVYSEKYPEDFYKNYLNTFLSVFLRGTRDLNEMRHLAEMNFPRYVAPVESGHIKMDDVSGLWRNIAPYLKTSLNDVYLGINSSPLSDGTDRAFNGENMLPASSNQDEKQLLTSKAQLALDLPYFSKFFLVAAFLASHNAAKNDRRLFAKYHGKKKKRLVENKKKENAVDSLLGPKVFPLDRLFAIFYSLLEQRTNLTANLMSQVSSLVELGFLLRQGDGLDCPKYKALVTLDCVEPVARTLGLNVRKYMMS